MDPPDSVATGSLDLDANAVASLEWLDEKMETANLDLVPENLEKVCLETWKPKKKNRWKEKLSHETNEIPLKIVVFP